jgi:hypothetical protein
MGANSLPPPIVGRGRAAFFAAWVRDLKEKTFDRQSAYELAIQLPEKSRLVHQIRTDDPSGIEEYWHKRFSDKHKNGEWFDLSSSDVKTFTRRKFMQQVTARRGFLRPWPTGNGGRASLAWR